LQKSYCTGEVGREANDTANDLQYRNVKDVALKHARAMLQANQTKTTSSSKPQPMHSNHLYGEVESNINLDSIKMQEALLKSKQETKKKDKVDDDDDRKRKYNSVSSYNEDVTEEDMEVYRMNRMRGDNPMSKYNFTSPLRSTSKEYTSHPDAPCVMSEKADMERKWREVQVPYA